MAYFQGLCLSVTQKIISYWIILQELVTLDEHTKEDLTDGQQEIEIWQEDSKKYDRIQCY